MEGVDERELSRVNARNTREYVPAIVLISLVVVVGIAANIFASVFYGFKARKSVLQIFVLSLALNDLVTNFVLVHDIVELFYFVQYKSAGACKLFYVLKHWLVGNSLLFMVAIAVDRYRRVCFPFSKQITLRIAWCMILGLAIFSFFIAVRSFATADILRINITITENVTIKGFYCTLSEQESLAKVDGVFHIVDICIHATIITLLVFFYSFIIRKLVLTRKKMQSHENLKIAAYKTEESHTDHKEGSSIDVVEMSFSSAHYGGTSETAIQSDKHCEEENKDKHDDLPNKGYFRLDDNSEHTKPSQNIHSKFELGNSTDGRSKQDVTKPDSPSLTPSRSRKRGKSLSETEKRMTIMVAVITLASIACFVPYYVSMMVFSPDLNGNGRLMSVGLIIARRSFILNSAINPFILAVFNLQFRQFLLGLCHRFPRIRLQ